MATISPRILSDGSITWRIQFRRKGIPNFSKSFCTEEEAREYVKKNELLFIKDYRKFIKGEDFLKDMREREFKRKGITQY